jgi:hypothetical protein
VWAYHNRFPMHEVQPSETHRLKRSDMRDAGWTWATEHEFDACCILVCGVLSMLYRQGR